MQFTSRVACLLALLCCLWGFAGVEGKRVKIRSVNDRMSPASKGTSNVTNDVRLTDPLEPFDVVVKVTNRQEVMDKNYEPFLAKQLRALVDQAGVDRMVTDHLAVKFIDLMERKLQEAGVTVSIKKKSIEGLTARLTLQIKSYDLAIVNGVEFAEHMDAVKQILKNLQMSYKYPQLEKKAAEKVRAKLLEILPESIGDYMDGVHLGFEIPAADPVLPGLRRSSPPPQFYRITISDREKVAALPFQPGYPVADAIKTSIVASLTEDKFMGLVKWKMEDDLPKMLREELGGALQVKVIVEPDESTVAGDSVEKRNFGMILKITDVAIDQLISQTKNGDETLPLSDFCPDALTAAATKQVLGNEWHCLVKFKGADFELNYQRLFAELEYLHEHGVETTQAVMDIGMAVWDMAIVHAESALQTYLQGALDPTIWEVSEDEYKMIKGTGKFGRCCGTTKKGEGQMFFVSKDMLGGAGSLLFGYFGRSGHCPTIDLERSCKQRRGAKTHLRNLMDCFDEAAMEDMQEGSMLGYKLTSSEVTAWCTKEEDREMEEEHHGMIVGGDEAAEEY